MIFIGSAKFHFKQGDTAPITLTDATLYPVKFPEGKASFESKPNELKVQQPSAGVNKVAAKYVTSSETTYNLTLTTYDMNIMSLLLNGPTPTSATLPTTIAVGTDFNHTGWGMVEWYNNGDTLGSPSFTHTGFKCSISSEGAFSMDPEKPAEVTLKIEVLDVSGTFAE